jgi:hypothetical protein
MKKKIKKSEKKNKTSRKINRKLNWRVIFYSLVALICIYLMYKIDWIFIVPVIIFIWLNQRELFKDSR